jgi:hypothetical protein
LEYFEDQSSTKVVVQSASEVENITTRLLRAKTREAGKNAVSHVKKVKAHYWARDNLVERS